MNKNNSITTIYLNFTSQKDKITNLYITISDNEYPIVVLGFPINFKRKQSLSNIISLIKTLDYDFSPIQVFKIDSNKNGNNYITVNEARAVIIKKLIELFTKSNIEFDTIQKSYNPKKKIMTIAEAEYDDKNYYEK